MDAWSTALGTQQGRSKPIGWTPVSGSYAFVLGHDLPDQWTKLAAGDFDSVSQAADFSGVSFLRWRAHVRPGATPAGVTWDFVVLVNGVECIRRTIVRDLDRNDFALPMGAWVASGSSIFGITFRVELVGAVGIYDVELPAVYIDALVLDTSPTTPVLINRYPEPGESSVPLVDAVAFDLAMPDGASALDTSTIDVTIDGVTVAHAGVGVGGYGATATVLADGLTVGVVIAPPAPWTSLHVYAVHVQAQTTAGSPLDVTYSFTTVDTIAPVVVSAFALDDTTVRVSFNEAVVGAGAYAISLISGVPAVTPVVVSVSVETSSTVLLTLDIEQTPGALYQVTVTGVADLFGNPIAAGNTAQWTGYACAGVAGRSFDLYGMMLRSDRASDETGDLRNFIGCFQEVTNLLLCKIDRFVEILDPDTASEQYVDRMLADLGNPFSFDLTLIDKRRLVQLLVAIYKSKGTDPGIINAIRFFLGIEVTITIPWQTGGLLGASTLGGTFILGTGDLATIYSFVIHSPVVLTEEQRKRIGAIARYMKRAPTHFTIVEPSPPPAVPSHWSLGVSSLGLNTLLH